MSFQYLVIGNGRLAQHFRYYLTQLKLPLAVWHRGEEDEHLLTHLKTATHILLLISDNALGAFSKSHLTQSKAYKIHCSGSLVSDHLIGAHPLQHFTKSLYPIKKYYEIPFVLDHDAPPFQELLPGFPNPHVRLHKMKKAKYHALCVLSGNFSCMLWQKLFSSLAGELGLSADIAHAYLKQHTENLMQNHMTALTGPLVRNDEATIAANLLALIDDPFYSVYKAFVDCYRRTHS